MLVISEQMSAEVTERCFVKSVTTWLVFYLPRASESVVWTTIDLYVQSEVDAYVSPQQYIRPTVGIFKSDRILIRPHHAYNIDFIEPIMGFNWL